MMKWCDGAMVQWCNGAMVRRVRKMLVDGGEDRVRTVVYMEHPLHRTNTAGFRWHLN